MKYVPTYLLSGGVAAANTTAAITPEGGQGNKFDGAIASGIIGMMLSVETNADH